MGQSFRLELSGPTEEIHPLTSNRAELRAVIAAVEHKVPDFPQDWWDEAWGRVVIVSKSAYVVDGITRNIATWQKRGWKSSAGKPITDRDLWERLLALINGRGDVEWYFWCVARGCSQAATDAARLAARTHEAEEKYVAGR